jgi:hypothetical protein
LRPISPSASQHLSPPPPNGKQQYFSFRAEAIELLKQSETVVEQTNHVFSSK